MSFVSAAPSLRADEPALPLPRPEIKLKIDQITHGPKHHLFGYIGHQMTIPWNGDGRYIVALEVDFRDRMPQLGEAATIVLIDIHDANRVIPIEKTLAWNLQQGTMLYWNPDAPKTQFLFNDLDPKTGQVFAVLYDIERRKRVREYRFDKPSLGNGNLSPAGEYFIGLNYGKLSNSRRVISYAGARDALEDGPANPDNDGLWRVAIATGERRLLVSYQRLASALELGDAKNQPLYVHHTLWNRGDDRILFVVRSQGTLEPNAWFTIHSDGSNLKRAYPGSGHPEWGMGKSLIVAGESRYELFDVDRETVVGHIGEPGDFDQMGADAAFSPDGRWFACGAKSKNGHAIQVLRIRDGAKAKTPGFGDGGRGDTRIDPAPRWNRTSDALLVPGVDSTDGTRQLFVIRIEE